MDTPFIARIRASAFMRALVFGVAYFGSAELGNVLTNQTARPAFAHFGAAAGVFVAALTLTAQRSHWLAIVLAASLASCASDVWLHDQSMLASVGFALARSAEACLGAWLLQRFCITPITLTRLNDVFGVAIWAAGVAPVLGATLGAGVAASLLQADFASTWASWWMAHAIGVQVIAPLIWTWDAEWARLLKRDQWVGLVERGLLLVGLFVSAEALYGEFLPAPFNVPVYVLPFLLVAAVRFDPATTTTALLVVAMVGLWNTSQGRGPFASLAPTPHDRLLRGMAAMGMISVSVLLLAAVVAERKEADRKRRALIDKLHAALAEIKTLRGLIPICAWCKKIRDGQDYWHSVEDYIVKNTEARLSHGMCPECLARAKEELNRENR